MIGRVRCRYQLDGVTAYERETKVVNCSATVELSWIEQSWRNWVKAPKWKVLLLWGFAIYLLESMKLGLLPIGRVQKLHDSGRCQLEMKTYPASCFLLVHPFPCTSTRATFRIPECMFLLAGKNMPGLKKIAHETRNSKTVLDWLGYCCSRTTVKTGLICQKK